MSTTVHHVTGKYGPLGKGSRLVTNVANALGHAIRAHFPKLTHPAARVLSHHFYRAAKQEPNAPTPSLLNIFSDDLNLGQPDVDRARMQVHPNLLEHMHNGTVGDTIKTVKALDKAGVNIVHPEADEQSGGKHGRKARKFFRGLGRDIKHGLGDFADMTEHLGGMTLHHGNKFHKILGHLLGSSSSPVAGAILGGKHSKFKKWLHHLHFGGAILGGSLGGAPLGGVVLSGASLGGAVLGGAVLGGRSKAAKFFRGLGRDIKHGLGDFADMVGVGGSSDDDALELLAGAVLGGAILGGGDIDADDNHAYLIDGEGGRHDFKKVLGDVVANLIAGGSVLEDSTSGVAAYGYGSGFFGDATKFAKKAGKKAAKDVGKKARSHAEAYAKDKVRSAASMFGGADSDRDILPGVPTPMTHGKKTLIEALRKSGPVKTTLRQDTVLD
jgi:hypothetical protein